MTTPELVVGLLFIACMEENEAIEVVGVERYSQYTGLAHLFCFHNSNCTSLIQRA